jgi:hypothetical protein
MDFKIPALAAMMVTALLLAGCQQQQRATTWYKPGATQQDSYVDQGQCNAQAQAFRIPGQGGLVPEGNMLQVADVYNTCMQGKGWVLK